MPRIAPTVLTPVPPIPEINTLYGEFCVVWGTGTGSAGSWDESTGSGFLRVTPSKTTKLGQKPSRQLKSLLHADWLIVRLRPNSVSN